MDVALPGSGPRFRRFASTLLAVCLGAASHVAAAPTYWQVQHSQITVLVEGEKDAAKRVAETALRLRSAARWLLSWPDSYREPPVLVIVVDDGLLRRTFEYHDDPFGPYTDPTAGHESWARTPSLVVVATHLDRLRGQELRPLQHAYGAALLRGDRSHDWPACIQVGMSLLFAAADLTPPNRFSLTGEKVHRGGDDFWNPERFLVPANARQERLPDWDRDMSAYSCYMLSFMIASAAPEQRAALERMLTAVGRGMPFLAATTSELQQTPAEFTARYREFGRSAYASPDFREIRVDLPEDIPVMPDPTPISPEAIQAVLGKLCGKLQTCRK
jgi:hypothetical protein